MMKKQIAWILALVFLLACCGCGSQDPQPPLVIHSGGTPVNPYENWVSSQYWTENGWLAADGYRISMELPRIAEKFPEITYGDDFEITYGKKATFLELDIYSSKFELVYNNTQLKALNILESGTYYIVITVRIQGRYIEAGKDYESSGVECAYKLIVTD